MRQRITAIFQENGIKVIGTVGLEATDFLDIFLDLRAGTYRSFVKEGHLPIYVHNQSNQNIGLGVNKRLSMLNSSEELFKQAMPVYQKALLRSKHNHQLKYNKDEVEGRPTRRRRTRNIYWNPPFSMNVKTNIGGRFLALIDRCFPKGSVMSKVFNRNNSKLSYRTLPNMKQVLAKHNKKVLAASNPKVEEKTWDCPKANREAGTCSLQGQCLAKNTIYQATVVETKPSGEEEVETYVGCCATEWKPKYINHNKSYKGETILSTHI